MNFKSLLLLFSLIISENYIYSAEADNNDATPVATEADNQNLIIAASWGNINEVLRLLSLNGINVNAKDPDSTLIDGWTALMTASFHGHLEIVQLLIKHNADVNATSKAGYTAISLTTEFPCFKTNNHKKIFEILLQNNAKFGIKDRLLARIRMNTSDLDVYNLLKNPDEYRQYAKNSSNLFVDALVAITPLPEELADMVMDRTSITFDLYLKAKKEEKDKRYKKIKNNLLFSLLAVGSYLAVNA